MARRGRRDGAGTGDEIRAARLERSAAPSGNPNPNPPSWRPATRDPSSLTTAQLHAPSSCSILRQPDARRRSAALRVPAICVRRPQAAFTSLACMQLASSDASRVEGGGAHYGPQIADGARVNGKTGSWVLRPHSTRTCCVMPWISLSGSCPGQSTAISSLTGWQPRALLVWTAISKGRLFRRASINASLKRTVSIFQCASLLSQLRQCQGGSRRGSVTSPCLGRANRLLTNTIPASQRVPCLTRKSTLQSVSLRPNSVGLIARRAKTKRRSPRQRLPAQTHSSGHCQEQPHVPSWLARERPLEAMGVVPYVITQCTRFAPNTG